ncbi:hypothetical protein [Thiomonas sp.]|jgi:hypothetical protein|uniref:hypothetical protein n=1 Tax=Thiomonas sp. TaxID=2047785 RepID=UPI00261B6D0D|nr:hypothetical protein [Thiomonas sp.]
MNPDKRAPRRGARRLAALAALGAALALGAAAPASAHVHWSVGIGIGAPGYWGGPGYPGYWGPGYWGPGWWPGPSSYYYAPPTVVVPAYQPPPVVYEAPRPLGPPPESFWYYCQNPAGYYPSVPNCPGGWTPVPARVAPAPTSH